MPQYSIFTAIILIILSTLLSSCSSLPIPETQYPDSDVEIQDIGENNNQYENKKLEDLLSESANYQESIPNTLAIQSLIAAKKEKNWPISESVFNKASPETMTTDEYGNYSIVGIDTLLQQKKYKRALNWFNSGLMNNHLPMMPVDHQIRLGILKSDTLFALKDFEQAAKERIYIDSLFSNNDHRQANRQAIWQSVSYLPLDSLYKILSSTNNADLKAWLELSAIHKSDKNLKKQSNELYDWQKKWAGSIAASSLPDSVSAIQRIALDNKETVAVFLPLSGKLKQAGSAIADGITAAYLNDYSEQQKPKLLFYDTNNYSISDLYNQAKSQGAELIIGPLQKELVASFFTMPTDIPILTLNFIQDDFPPPQNVILFGLSVEDEARQLAEYASRKEAKNILVLNTHNNWATKAASVFRKHWEYLNPYSSVESLTMLSLSDTKNYSAEIAQILNVKDSNSRLRKLENMLGDNIESRPRIREDIDLIVMFANNQQAKSIKPLLAYHYAGSLPVIASSQAFDGKLGNGKNSDLNGMIMSEMPWIFKSELMNDNNLVNETYAKKKSLNRLFAMGMDAYKLHNRLSVLQTNPYLGLESYTGKLFIRNNRVERELGFISISKGNAKELAID